MSNNRREAMFERRATTMRASRSSGSIATPLVGCGHKAALENALIEFRTAKAKLREAVERAKGDEQRAQAEVVAANGHFLKVEGIRDFDGINTMNGMQMAKPSYVRLDSEAPHVLRWSGKSWDFSMAHSSAVCVFSRHRVGTPDKCPDWTNDMMSTNGKERAPARSAGQLVYLPSARVTTLAARTVVSEWTELLHKIEGQLHEQQGALASLEAEARQHAPTIAALERQIERFQNAWSEASRTIRGLNDQIKNARMQLRDFESKVADQKAKAAERTAEQRANEVLLECLCVEISNLGSVDGIYLLNDTCSGRPRYRRICGNIFNQREAPKGEQTFSADDCVLRWNNHLSRWEVFSNHCNHVVAFCKTDGDYVSILQLGPYDWEVTGSKRMICETARVGKFELENHYRLLRRELDETMRKLGDVQSWQPPGDCQHISSDNTKVQKLSRIQTQAAEVMQITSKIEASSAVLKQFEIFKDVALMIPNKANRAAWSTDQARSGDFRGLSDLAGRGGA